MLLSVGRPLSISTQHHQLPVPHREMSWGGVGIGSVFADPTRGGGGGGRGRREEEELKDGQQHWSFLFPGICNCSSCWIPPVADPSQGPAEAPNSPTGLPGIPKWWSKCRSTPRMDISI
ncbi:hypothetical protein ILYODFUR_004714 [Ilyodon furcidens]|uniref:Uncharacterized protein n=1 Tax=Ilyodon furcidens TaxID=33524 RepID=A0ABV0VB44_9TELE